MEEQMLARSARTLLMVRLLQLKLYNQMVETLRLFELTPLQYLVLSLAGYSSRSSTADLARRFEITPQSMNEVIAALEAKRLIARRESPGHRRILHIRLTAVGTRLLRKCDVEVDRIERSAFRDFSAKELAAFRGMISKALAAFEEHAGLRLPVARSSAANGGRRANERFQ